MRQLAGKKIEQNNKTIALNILFVPKQYGLHANQNITVSVKIK